MRLNATTTKAAKPKTKTTTTTRLSKRTTTTSTLTKRQIERFLCNLIHLVILTTTIMCSVSAIGTGLLRLPKAKASRVSNNNDNMHDYAPQFDELLPVTAATSATVELPATATAATAAATATSAVFQFTAAAADTHMPTHTHMQSTRISYDSNEIDNSYAAAVEPAAAADVALDAAAADDVETVADDYIMVATTDEKNDKPATAAAAATMATATSSWHLMNARAQDLLSLSQLSSDGTSSARTPAQHEKNASSLKNSIGGAISSAGTTFQQIGSQKINGHVTTAPANNSAANQPAATPSSISTASATHRPVVHNSAKKVDSKYILPKPQKTDAPMLNYIFDTHSSANKHHHHDQRYGPHFEDVQRVGQPTNMTVQAGSSIHLNCRISLLQDKTVSWVRRSAQNEENALDLLTVGLTAYTGDKRYKMEFQYPNNWRLRIVNVKKDDEATYECQISTHPPRVIQINLHVNAPKVMIVDEYGDPLQEKYYEIDSTLQLSCVVRNVAMTSSVVFWKHSDDTLNYDVTRGGVSVKTELMEDGANSTLSIAKINKADSGNYTCAISEFQNFSIVVHILNGESFAELHLVASGLVQPAWLNMFGICLLLLLISDCRWFTLS